MSTTTDRFTREAQALLKAARRANTDAGFAYLERCQPKLVLELMTALRARNLGEPAELQRFEALAKDAAGKRTISDDGMAFVEACDPQIIINWCRLLGAH